MAGFLVPFATGALGKVMDTREEQDQISGAMIDAASEHYLTNLNDEKLKLKNVDKVYKNIEDAYGTNVAEAMAHWGYLDSGDLPTAYQWLEKIGPTNIEKLKTADIKDLQPVFENNFASTNKALESKENVLAKNLNRGDLKNLSDLYFGKNIKKGKLDSTRQFLFGGPILGEEDVVPSMLQLEKEIGKEKATLEEPDEQLLAKMDELPMGPLAMASGTGVKDSEYRLRQTISADVALSSVGLEGTYSRVEGGPIKFTDFTEADHTLFTAANVLISRAFMTQNYDINTYRETGAQTGAYLRRTVSLIDNSTKTFIAEATKKQQTDKTFRVDAIIDGKFNQAGYDFWLIQNAQMVAAYAADDAIRPVMRIKFGNGKYLAYFNKLDEELKANAGD